MESNDIKKLIQDEIPVLRNISFELKSKIDSGASKLKKRYYEKKLKNHNEYFARLLITLSKIELADDLNEENITK